MCNDRVRELAGPLNTDIAGVAGALPGYEIEGEIGRGQFGVVWRARHRHLGRAVAIKQLAGSDTAAYRARFRREARVLAQIDHPHVVRVYDYHEEGDLRFLVMELLPGGTLADRRSDGIDPPNALAATLAAASGLYHVHLLGILHRDVTPQNLMFDQNGTLKVTDFGVARVDLVDATTINVTQAGEFFGTPAYVSPEQAAHALNGAGAAVGPATDQYSLAAVLYETLSGELTHDTTGGAIALCNRRINEDARPLRDVAPDVDREIETVVMKALARDPAARYVDMQAFAVALASGARASLGDDWLAGGDVQLREAGPILDAATGRTDAGAAPEPAPRRKLRARLIVGAVVVVAVVAGVFAFLSRGGSPSSKTDSGGSAQNPIGNGSQLLKQWSASTGGAVFSSPAISDDTVVVGSDDESVRAFDAGSGAPRWKFATGGPVRSSPTIVGNNVYIASNDGYVYDLDLASGKVVWKTSTGFEIVARPAVANGTVVVGADKLYAFDAATGAKRWTFTPKQAIVSSPAIANGVVVFGSNDKNVYGVDLATGAQRWHLPTGDMVQSSPKIVDGIAYVGSNDGDVYAIDIATGKTRWGTDLGAPVKSSPAVANGLVFVGTDSGKFAALDATTGRTAWTFVAPDRIDSSPLVVHNAVVVGSNDGRVYAFDASTGRSLGSFKTNGAVLSSPVASGLGVVVGSNDNTVYDITGFATAS